MQHQSPFDGAPYTKIFTDKEERRAFIVKARYLTPWRFKLTRLFASMTALAVMTGGLFAVSQALFIEDWVWIAALVAPWLLWPLWFSLFRLLLSRKQRITLTESHVDLGRFLFKKRFDRSLNHKFALVAHDAAREEQRKHELHVRREAGRGRAVSKIPVYANSFHLSFDYLGQRNDLMTIYGQEEALKILTRLIACDEVLNAQAGLGEGFTTSAEDEWTDGPGSL